MMTHTTNYNHPEQFSRLNDPFFVLLHSEFDGWTDEERAEMKRRQADADAYEVERAEAKRIQAERPICPRCSGRGVMHEYGHIQNGKCFRCGGSGYDD